RGMEPRFAAPERHPADAASSPASHVASSVSAAPRGTVDNAVAAGAARPLLLALAVHWDDCSVALGNRDCLSSETWSQQPERAAAAGKSSAAGAIGGSPVASRDALLLLDRLLARAGTSLSAVDRLCFAR